MLILSNGMIKSGSSLMRHYTIALVDRLFAGTGQKELRRLVRAKHFHGSGSFINHLGVATLASLLTISDEYGPVIVKVHLKPEPFLLEALRAGRIKMTYIHRDPRDVVLSAMDHRVRSQGTPKPVFTGYGSIEESISHVHLMCKAACEWISTGLACVVRYDNLLLAPEKELSRICAYLNLPASETDIEQVIQEERQIRQPGKNQFNIGQLTRFQTEMSEEQLKTCNQGLRDVIVQLGYSI
ncbi:MAG TPA: sulfotransferase domain-containing protein [Opitutaceae bacterium]|jgi:hypothetical protein|nr:sulfotransferase domain-containing protein [Opitutaceae bacterium]